MFVADAASVGIHVRGRRCQRRNPCSWPTLPASESMFVADAASVGIHTDASSVRHGKYIESDRVDQGSQTQIDAWIADAKRGELGWSELAERLLSLEHPKPE